MYPESPCPKYFHYNTDLFHRCYAKGEEINKKYNVRNHTSARRITVSVKPYYCVYYNFFFDVEEV